jgi:NitT/TauT family transport system ATP-binding protein
LSLAYDETTPVLEKASLTIDAGRFVSLVGPSGSGKSSLLRAVMGLQRPMAGLIESDVGVREIGMLFQDDALLPWRSAADNVALGLRLRGESRAQARAQAAEWLARLGLTGLGERYPRALSGGQRKRVALAQVLALKPRLLLMDEPFAAVDAQTREILQFELLRIWQKQPTTMLFVTHSIEEAVLMGDRVVVLKGRPSQVDQDIAIDLPRPRSRETLSLPRFSELREQVWSNLMNEARRAEFELEH